MIDQTFGLGSAEPVTNTIESSEICGRFGRSNDVVSAQRMFGMRQ